MSGEQIAGLIGIIIYAILINAWITFAIIAIWHSRKNRK